MLADKAFFSFTSVIDPACHRDYNRWHQLDHRPENLALPGVRWGERWVRSPDCARAGTASAAAGDVGDTHYLNTYWFADPVEASIAEWQDLAERSFQWGRRPEVAWAERPLMGFFDAVKGYAHPRVLVSPDALPFRPNTGVHLTLTRLRDPHHPRTQEAFAWHDQVRVPALLSCDGVAGVWTFSSASTTLDPDWQADPASSTFDPAGGVDPGRYRIELCFLDGDPIEVAAELPGLSAVDGADGDLLESSGLASPLLSGPLRSIEPWRWDWFDEETATPR